MMIQIVFIAISFVMVAFGQPAWISWAGLLAAAVGYALFWWPLNQVENSKNRFWLATLWFTGVQIVQLSWFVSHPYIYIWPIYFILSLLIGLQFGALSLLVRKEKIEKYWKIVAISGIWTLLEWGRLYVLSGFSWNPVGLALSGSLYPLQLSSILGIYGLSFWVIGVNLLALRAIYKRFTFSSCLIWLLMASVPYIYGFAQVTYHDRQIQKKNSKNLVALLVQTSFPIEECLACPMSEFKKYVEGEWRQIIRTLKPFHRERIDLIVLPEYVVPYGTWTPMFKWVDIRALFTDSWGLDSLLQHPPLQEPFAQVRDGEWWVSNAFIVQTLSNLFQAEVVAGLEDADLVNGEMQYYNAAIVFEPFESSVHGTSKRYEKRVLVPMGEYIPFEFCRDLAKSYGVGGSFTCGNEAKVFQGSKGKFGLSICYEETYAHLMRESKLKGAEFLVNLTSDVWYPNSKLIRQHLDHSRLRATEGGLPLLRACNTGVTCAIDSLGRTIDSFGEDESRSGALKVDVSLYNYFTPYTLYGDHLIVGVSSVMGMLLFLRRKN